MKRIFAVLICLAVLLTAALPCAAAVNVTEMLNELGNHYAAQDSYALWEEYVVLSARNLLNHTQIPELYRPARAEAIAQQILIGKATGNESGLSGLPETLKDLQTEDGNFAGEDGTVLYSDTVSVREHCLCVLALRAAGVVFNSPAAYRWLLSEQKEDGSFGTAEETALAIAVLSSETNEEEQTAKQNAAKYFAKYEAKTETSLCWQIIGIVDAGFDPNTTENRDLTAKLLSYRNNTDGTYSDTYDTTAAEPKATVLATAAYDAIARGSSCFVRLARDGKVSAYDIAELKPVFIGGGILLAASVGFWVFVFLHKKNAKTLEETKKY